jgi:signal transduction histidine kinase
LRLGNILKNRYPFIIPLFLALVISGCVFFWYQSQQRLQLYLLDAQLTLATDLFASDLVSGDSCARLSQFNNANQQITLSLYDKDATPLCEDPSVSATGRPTSSLAQNSKLITRQLPGSDLVIQARGIYSPQQPRSSCLPLLLLCIALLAIAYWLQLGRGRNRATQALIEQLEQNIATQPPIELDTQSVKDPLLRRLIVNYNKHIAELSDSLSRAHQFTANVTHELRTPLTILRGESEIALRSERSNDELRSALESNLEESNRMSRLIDDLLLLAKSELGEIPIRHDRLYLAELIPELQYQTKILAKKKNISILLDWTTGKDLYLAADNLRLRQVFLNLLSNAIQYTPEGGTITIRVVPQEQDVNISIIDSGVGIAAEHLQHIFERFYRVDKNKNRNDGGSGLGLAIAQWIVEAHRGKITAQSQPGKGSCFTVTLPLDTDAVE